MAKALPLSVLAANLTRVDKGNYQTFNKGRKYLAASARLGLFVLFPWELFFRLNETFTKFNWFLLCYLKSKVFNVFKILKNIIFEFGFAPLLFANSLQQSK